MNNRPDPIAKAKTIDEMRRAIFDYQFEEPMVRSVMCAADYNGLSGEDRYVTLAYHALDVLSEIRSQLLEFYRHNPKPVIVPIQKEGEPE